MPEGQTRSFAQMDDAEKQSISMRTIALNKLRDYSHPKKVLSTLIINF
jgi:inosine/xanthosine triphosphate pyrophosphatase family protein